MKLNKKSILACILLTFVLVSPGLVYAKKPEYRLVYNDFGLMTVTSMRVLPNGITIMDAVSLQTWTGDGWDGEVVQEFTMISRTSGNGHSTAKGTGVFTGTVDGKEGTVHYTLNQIANADFTYLKGTMTITKGTGELTGIKGHGILDLALQSTHIYMHFEP